MLMEGNVLFNDAHFIYLLLYGVGHLGVGG